MAVIRRQFETNVFGLIRMTQLALPGMRRQRWGKIVNLSSMGGKLTLPGGSMYHATKHAVEALSDALRFEVRDFGIDVVVIQPGGIATEWHHVAGPSLLAASGEGPYAAQAQRMAATFELEADGIASPPSVIARAVARAVRARRPRTRYRVGRGAWTLLTARWLLPDRLFDRVMMLIVAAMVRVAPRVAARNPAPGADHS
jgi:NAD(P)-dependent dehydrogenase (short-subunit alcohol dehydrogenase family)